jgi:GTP-binding protein
MYLVDLPGYGYARGSGSGGREAAVREFDRLVNAYFAREGASIGTVLLVDSRHPGLESDLDAWAWLTSQPYPSAIVGTKVDKLTRAERVRNTRQLESMFNVPVLLVSAQNGEGLEQLWKLIARLPNPTAA